MANRNQKELVEILRTKEISNEDVLAAFLKVDRIHFVPEIMKHHAYKDTALPIGYEQTISQPYTVAFMSSLLNVKSGDKVLEIGTGSGFQAAILVAMGARVFTIERNSNIYNRTLKLIDNLGLRIAARCSDGTIGWAEYAPYDGIIVTAGGPSIPDALKKQLAVGGQLVIPVGSRGTQALKVVTKVSESDFKIVDHPNFLFVPLIGKDGWENR